MIWYFSDIHDLCSFQSNLKDIILSISSHNRTSLLQYLYRNCMKYNCQWFLSIGDTQDCKHHTLYSQFDQQHCKKNIQPHKNQFLYLVIVVRSLDYHKKYSGLYEIHTHHTKNYTFDICLKISSGGQDILSHIIH